VQKIATNLIYIEKGRAYTFDRLSAFEDWLERGQEPLESDAAFTAIPDRQLRESPSPLSKNRRDQLKKEVTQLEQKIAFLEGQVAEMELAFQNPATGTDWESTHQKYADLKATLEGLYEDLASRWELMG
jgi:hypothetical protein